MSSQPASEIEQSEQLPPVAYRRPALPARAFQLIGGAFGALALIFLIFGRLNWTVGGEAELIVADGGVRAIVRVPETDIALIVEGQPAELSLRAYPGAPIRATVRALGASAEVRDGQPVTVPVTLDLSAQPELTLRAGFTGRAEIVVARDRAGLVLWGRLSRFLLQWL